MKIKLSHIAISLVIVLGGIFFFSACEKDKPMITTKPTVMIKSASESGVCAGNVTEDGRDEVTSRGFIYSENSSLSNPITKEAGKGLGEYTATLDQLSPSTTYYVKAFATNSNGTSYSSEVKTFKTSAAPTKPIVTINSASALGTNSASCSGNVTSDGGSAVTSRGFKYSTNSSFTNSQTKTVGSGTGSFTTTLTGLEENTTYYVKAFATNSQGTSYSSQVKSFTTQTSATVPTVTMVSASAQSSSTASCSGNVTSDGGSAVTSRGFQYSTNSSFTNSQTKTVGSGTGSFSTTLTGLSENTTYYVKAFATNSQGTSYSSQVKSFTTQTSATVPTVTMVSASAQSSSTASCSGNVTSDGGSTVTSRGFEYSTSSSFSNSQTKTVGSGTGSFSTTLTGLSENTTYYVKAFATNSQGTSYSTQVKSFTTQTEACPSPLTDYDGNSYSTVQIGQQCWMKQNLRTTHYANGTSISLGSSTSTTTAYRYYPNNSSGNVSTYGYLYNWKAVMRNSSSSSSNPSGVQGICPTGWHVPSLAEWTQLTDYVSSQSQYVCGSNNSYIAKALASTTGWNSYTSTCAVGNNPSANNATGFTAVPAGYYYGGYYSFGYSADFWSSTVFNSNSAYGLTLYYSNANVSSGTNNKGDGFSVRCLRD